MIVNAEGKKEYSDNPVPHSKPDSTADSIPFVPNGNFDAVPNGNLYSDNPVPNGKPDSSTDLIVND